MLKRRVIPCLLLSHRGLVKTIKFKDPKYIGDPINAVRIFNDKEVDEIIVLDIDATPDQKEPCYDQISDIASECFMPLGYGGGITKIEQIRKIFNLGAEKVIINSMACERPDFIKEAADNFGSQSIVVCIDVKKNILGNYEVYSNAGKKKLAKDPITHASVMEQCGAGEIIINSIDRDGTFNGYDVRLIKMISEQIGVPVVASGGAGKITDFAEAIKQGGASAVSAGSMFVLQKKHRAVLISYPSTDEINAVLGEKE